MPTSRSIARYSRPRMAEDREPTQKTPKGLEIPVPKRRSFDDLLKKVAPPVGRKRPAGKDQPPEQSR
jgi:hypothetical protein